MGVPKLQKKREMLIQQANAICNAINKVCSFKVQYADVETLKNHKRRYAEDMNYTIRSVIMEISTVSHWVSSSTVNLYEVNVRQAIQKMSTCELKRKK